MANKFEWTEATAPKPVKMEDLVCKDCFHRSGRVDICAAYQRIKPISVIDGGDCDFYKKEEEDG